MVRMAHRLARKGVILALGAAVVGVFAVRRWFRIEDRDFLFHGGTYDK